MRRTLTIFAAGIVTAAGAHAAPAKVDTCATVARIAELIMSRRQEGQPLDRMLEAVKSSVGAQHIQSLVVAAYDVPLQDTDEAKERAIETFSTEGRITCMKLLEQP